MKQTKGRTKTFYSFDMLFFIATRVVMLPAVVLLLLLSSMIMTMMMARNAAAFSIPVSTKNTIGSNFQTNNERNRIIASSISSSSMGSVNSDTVGSSNSTSSNIRDYPAAEAFDAASPMEIQALLSASPSQRSEVVVPASDQNNGREQHQPQCNNKYGPLSMSFEELVVALDGGVGRAKSVWDLYRIGVDPVQFFGGTGIQFGSEEEYDSIYNHLPTSRRKQLLGPKTLVTLYDLYTQHKQQNHNQNQQSNNPNNAVDAAPTDTEANNNNENAAESDLGGLASLSHVSRSTDHTTKLLLKLHDGLEVETVIIPWPGTDGKPGRSTLCISSQVGCRQGCTFCATGKMGKLRNLSSDEILVQMYYAQKLCRQLGPDELPKIANVVFMGMGEPADNIENVVRAAKVLTTQQFGYGLAAHKILISTVGPTPQAFLEIAQSQCCVLAWSVHAVNDALRKKLVPTTQYTMVELRQGLIDAILATKPKRKDRVCMLEIALMKDVNDQPEHAKDVVEFVRGMLAQVPGLKVHVNLIPFNDIGGGTPYKKPLEDTVRAFHQQLQTNGICTHIRATRGDDKTSACGQLATTKRKKKKTTTTEPESTPSSSRMCVADL